MFEQTLRFLVEDGWPVEPGTYDALPCIDTHFAGTDGEWDCRARPYDPFGQLAFESVLPFVVPPELRVAMTDAVVRTNWQLLTGAFQVDLDTGVVLFRTMLFLAHDAEPTAALLRGLVYGNVLTVDRCLAGLADVAAGGEPSLAVELLAL